MSHKSVYACVNDVVPCCHMKWRKEDIPPLPWAVYTGEEFPIRADNGTAAVRNDWTVELYEHSRDAELERKLGEAIRAEFGSYVKRETWVESEDCLMVTYDFSEFERIEDEQQG